MTVFGRPPETKAFHVWLYANQRPGIAEAELSEATQLGSVKRVLGTSRIVARLSSKMDSSL